MLNKKTPLALFIFFLLAASTTASADSKSVWPPSWLKCGEEAQGKLKIPNETTRDTLIQLLHPAPLKLTDEEMELVCVVGVKEWKQRRASIALVQTEVFRKNGFGGVDTVSKNINLAVIETPIAGEPIAVKAKLEQPVSLKESSDSEELDFLDTASYLMSEGKFAFGIRTTERFAYAGGGGGNQVLRLFHEDKGVIAQILWTPVSSLSFVAGEWNEDGTRDYHDNDGGSAILEIAQTKTQGVFDIVKKLKGPKKAKMMFRWDGREFKSSDQEIIENVNE